MSRTPEKITDEKAVQTRSNVYFFAVVLALISWGCFENNASGAGLTFALGSFVMFWAGGKIKTVYHKNAEVSRYTKR